MVPPGKGPTLKAMCPSLRDDAQRRAQILDVIERDSVIEGLPPLEAETRDRILQQLEAIGGPEPAPAE